MNVLLAFTNQGKSYKLALFLERKIGGGVRKEERVNSTKKCTSTIYTSQRSECNILKKTYKREECEGEQKAAKGAVDKVFFVVRRVFSIEG